MTKSQNCEHDRQIYVLADPKLYSLCTHPLEPAESRNNWILPVMPERTKREGGEGEADRTDRVAGAAGSGGGRVDLG